MLWHFSADLIMSRSKMQTHLSQRKIVVGNAGEDMGVNLEEPTLIYSRPKGEYSGADTGKTLLLDFFLLNYHTVRKWEIK